jgi:hypothetical protein
MPTTPPITGPHTFSAVGTPEQIQQNALVFMAERLASIEWLMFEMNNKMFKVQTDIGQINHKTRP